MMAPSPLSRTSGCTGTAHVRPDPAGGLPYIPDEGSPPSSATASRGVHQAGEAGASSPWAWGKRFPAGKVIKGKRQGNHYRTPGTVPPSGV